MGCDARLFDVDAKRYFDVGLARHFDVPKEYVCAFGCQSIWGAPGVCFACLIANCTDRNRSRVSAFVKAVGGFNHKFMCVDEYREDPDDMWTVAENGGYTEWSEP